MIFVHFLIVFITRFFTIDSMRLYLRGKSAQGIGAENATEQAALAAEAAEVPKEYKVLSDEEMSFGLNLAKTHGKFSVVFNQTAQSAIANTV
jgi:hypothetical protein